MSSWTWISLNVGGQKFVTNASVFMKDPDCMLAKMFNGDMRPGEKDEDGAYLIDRSPDYFKPILNYFRTGKLIIDPVLSVDGVLEEAKYYGIDRLIHLIEEFKLSKLKEESVGVDEMETLRKVMELHNMKKELLGRKIDMHNVFGEVVFDEIKKKVSDQVYEIRKKYYK